MSASYRSRLEALEQSIQPKKTDYSAIKNYGIYVSIIVIWLILLVAFTPSFLYTAKRKHKPAKRSWTKIIIVWIILSAATCGGWVWYQNK